MIRKHWDYLISAAVTAACAVMLLTVGSAEGQVQWFSYCEFHQAGSGACPSGPAGCTGGAGSDCSYCTSPKSNGRCRFGAWCQCIEFTHSTQSACGLRRTGVCNATGVCTAIVWAGTCGRTTCNDTCASSGGGTKFSADS